MTATAFKRALAVDPEQAMSGVAAVHSGAASVIVVERGADGTVMPLVSYEPETARTGVVLVLTD